MLRVLDGPTPALHQLDGTTFTVGRSQLADIVVEHGSVSKLHLQLQLDAAGVRLRDLGSTNGTWWGGRRVEAFRLEPGDEFLAGECRVRLESVAEVEVEVLDSERFGQLHGDSLAMRELYMQLETLGPTPLDILVLGETGTGKELTAQTIHELARPRRPFVTLDCASLSSTLAEGTLFGFRKGAFTGADRDQPGIFEAASGGTLFMDEVGELSLALQRKLLGVLERRQVSRMGEPGRQRPLDLRIVAATHRDLRQAVAKGEFREDLYYRLARAIVRTPALRERGEDVLTLTELFLDRIRRDFEVHVELDEDASAMLVQHDWPGNVRELRNVIERAAHTCRGGVIRSEHLMLATPSPAAHLVSDDRTYAELHAAVDQLTLPRLLDRYGGNLSHLAKHLEISRDTLRRRLKALGLYAHAQR
ncbi:sigma 54-interacting transcriptional regulator [Pseudenhygromyxa sp. WMMC2535]|uniref:sigma 54-interacting transcriptional regulator n=1 Tax=Pseudenhygromyxa sp. WMMC2535 TaxID=2712867 RepID=UPI00155354D9|nr:sigma 54-interacting transcriptional regulator [Pseudenhygromyxa sp. WMMC2535]